MLTNRATRVEGSKVAKHGTIRYVVYGFILVFYSNFFLIRTVLEIFDLYIVTLQSGLGDTQGHQYRHVSTVTYGFLLAFYSRLTMDRSRTVSEINRDFSQKSQNFPTTCIWAPADGVPFGIGYRGTESEY